jgi:hypothetical protein
MMPASKDPLPGDGQPTGSLTTGSGGGQQATQSGPGVQSSGDQMGPGSADKAGNEPGSSVPASAALTGSSGGGKGPIGAVGETIPAKFSQRNDILDRTPMMALPSGLTDQERQQIYQAVMADKSQPATDADALAPASELSTRQALDEMHELPASVKGIGGVSKLKFVKAKNKVLLVEPSTRTVVEQITS